MLGYQFVTESRRGKDDVVVAWKASKFNLVDSFGIQQDDLCEMFPSVKDRADDFKRGNCATFATLEEKSSGKKF